MFMDDRLLLSDDWSFLASCIVPESLGFVLRLFTGLVAYLTLFHIVQSHLPGWPFANPFMRH